MRATTSVVLCATFLMFACEDDPKPERDELSPVKGQQAPFTETANDERARAQALGGEMQYMADAARFTECVSGRSYPMAMERDFKAVERAYLDAVEKPGGRLYVTFEGNISPRPAMDRQGTEETVVVERFIHAWPGERCERAKADAALVNTYWRVVQLGESVMTAQAGRKEPHVVLADQDGTMRYRATVGCNQLAGEFQVDGNDITFKIGPTTLMACPPPMDAHERALSTMMSQAKHWRVLGNTLELFDESGCSVVLFQAIYL